MGRLVMRHWRGHSCGRCRHHGWSIVELLVVTAIVATFVAIAVPAFQAVRMESQEAVSRTYLRTHAQVFATYVSDFKETLPFLAAASEQATRYETGGYSADMLVLLQYATWPIALAEPYYSGDLLSKTFHPPSSELGGPISEYWYSQSFVADPGFWIQEQRQYSMTQLRAVAAHEVLFPSAKGLCVERDQVFAYWELGWEGGGRPINIALFDGSARAELGDDMTRPYPGGCRGYLLGPIIGLPVMHTVGGVRGRDLGP